MLCPTTTKVNAMASTRDKFLAVVRVHDIRKPTVQRLLVEMPECFTADPMVTDHRLIFLTDMTNARLRELKVYHLRVDWATALWLLAEV